MFKLDGISYPEHASEILEDPHLGPMFRAHLDKKMVNDKYEFLDATRKKRDPKSQFKIFFADNAKWQVNAGSEALVTAKQLGKAKDWKSKKWDKVYDIAIGYTDRFITGEFVEPFYYKNEAFRKHHTYMLQKRMLKVKFNPGLLYDLNTANKKEVADMAALLQTDKGRGTKAVKAFTKKKKISLKPAEVVKKIKKAFKIK